MSLPIVSASEAAGRELADELSSALFERRAARERRGGYNAGYRCFDCKRFVSGPEVRCGSCGYQHGGQNHRAQPTR